METYLAAYIAGIIDGEGSISLIKFHHNQHPSPLISISSSDLELLEWICIKTGYGRITKKKNYKPAVHKDSYTLNIRYNQALELLKYISPYLVIKRKKDRALLLLSKYKSLTVRNGRYSREQLAAKEQFYREFIEL